MGRRYGVITLLLALGLLSASVSGAGVPDPNLSTVPNVTSAPGGGLLYNVTIVGSSGPIDSANVTLVWSSVGDTAACWCPTQLHPSISSTTNASGVATFNVKGGGCLNPATISGGIAVSVYVNSIKLKEVGQVSPDVVSTSAGPCVVGLSDAVDFTPPLATAVYSFCYDLNSDLQVGLADATILTPFAAGGASCGP